MSSKQQLQAFEAETCVQAGWFGRSVKKGEWAKAASIVGGMTAGLAALAEAKEANVEAAQDELRRAGLMVDEIALHVAEKAQGAAVEAYAAFLRYLPEAHGRLAEMVDDPGSRGGDTKEVVATVANRAVSVLGLG